ncbi:4Fe-4S dicluster domain-containing protein [Patescibacteria group bacterium]|nr:4Fe-4S dicluster domain-containing protein [Patescibacteria group bacterium]
MAFYTVEKRNIPTLLDNLMKDFTLIAPVKKGKATSFEQVSSPEEVMLTTKNTDLSPKGSFFPQNEVMFSYKGGEVQKEGQETKMILFGVRPCDAKGFTLLDRVFIEGDFEDSYYKDRRKNSCMFGVSCNQPQATCFCASFDAGPFSKEGMDVSLVDLGESFLLESVTEKGDEILSRQGLPGASRKDIDRAGELEKKAKDTIRNRLNISGLKDKLYGSFDNPVWEELHQRCVGCGICTFFCPTCHCFDIVDEGDAEKGERIRIWDSCMFPLFTLHASGHQPRKTGKERMRQRIMHKFNYFPEKFGEAACVGCGRCIVNCPVNLDIREVIQELR